MPKRKASSLDGVSASGSIRFNNFESVYIPGTHRAQTERSVWLLNQKDPNVLRAYARSVDDAYPKAVRNRADTGRIYLSNAAVEEAGKMPEDYVEELDVWFRNGAYISGVLRRGHLLKSDLENVMKWKISISKWRPLLKGLLQKNSDAAVVDATKDAISFMNGIRASPSEMEERVLNAITALCRLKNVGPITATAILFNIYPHIIAYGCDEAIEATGYDRNKMKRPKDICEYLKKARRVASAYGVMPRDVSDALWTVAWDDEGHENDVVAWLAGECDFLGGERKSFRKYVAHCEKKAMK